MTKKEIQEKLNNLPKPEYLYQRYNGIINKYEIQDNILINVNNANDIIDINKQALLGKTSKNIIDLIEVGDFIKISYDNIGDSKHFIDNKFALNMIKEDLNKFKDKKIKSIVTKEQFKDMEFLV